MRKSVPVLSVCVFLLAGAAHAAQGYYATKADEKAGRLTPGRAPGDSATRSPNVGGENCGTATAIGSVPFTDSDNTNGHVDDNNSIPAGCSDYTATAGPDLIYSFTSGPGNNIVFNLNPTDNIYDAAIYVLGTCGTSATCVIGADACLANGQPQPAGCTDGDGDEDIPGVLNRFTPGTHAIYIDSFYSATAACPAQGNNLCGKGPYTLTVTGVLPAELINIRIE
jgi:hypothetical protein